MEKVEHSNGRSNHNSDEYQKSNFLIGSKYKSTLIENKVLAIALSNINKATQESENSNIVLELPASLIKEALGDHSGSIYKRLEPVAQAMTGRSIGITDEKNQRFDYFSVITRATYNKGVFRIEFNHVLKDYMLNLKEKYTLLSLPTMMAFRSVYSFRLYELLKSNAYASKKMRQERFNNGWEITFNLSELKFELGVINAAFDRVQKILKNSDLPDYEKAEAEAPEKNFSDWRDFRRYVLDVAKEEINETTELSVDYETVKRGRGGKVVGVTFIVSYKDKADKKPEIIADTEDKPEDELCLIEEVQNYIDEKVTIQEVKKLLKVADNDVAKIKEAYLLAKETPNINNLVGWLYRAIEEGYTKPIRKTKKKESSFNNFSQREISEEEMNELERKLIK